MKKVLCTILIIAAAFIALFMPSVSAEEVTVTVTADGGAWANATYDSGTKEFRNVDGNYFFRLTLNAGDKTAPLARGDLSGSDGKIVIPSKVEIDGEEYKITLPNNYLLATEGGSNDNDNVTELIVSEGIDGTPAGQIFRGAKALKKVTLPSTLPVLSNNIFMGCVALESIEIPELVTAIPNQAFSGCTSLKTVTFKGQLTSIGESSFTKCTVLTGLVIPKTVVSIGASAFSECHGIIELVIPAGVTVINNSTFNQTGTAGASTNLIFEGNITKFGTGVFSYYRFAAIIFKGDTAPTELGNIGTQSSKNTAEIKICYPADGTGYDTDAFRAFFNFQYMVHTPIGCKADSLIETANGYKVEFSLSLWPYITSSRQIAAFYNESELIAVKSTTDLDTASLEIETEKQVTRVKVYVWYDFENAKPIFSSSETNLL